MKYLFIVNPHAGGKNSYNMVKNKVEEYFSTTNHKYAVFQTERPGHAEEIVKEQLSSGEKTRVYAVGGDGTLLEVVRGAYGFENAEIGVFPVGSGNDYVRNYGSRDEFLSFSNQINGKAIDVDMIESNEGLALNICSVGLDAKVAYNMTKFKTLPGVGGSLAYDISLIKCLTSRLGEELEVKIKTTKGEESYKGNFLFALAASGQWYGGGYKGAPKARTNDGLLDFILIKKPAFTKIPALVNVYKAGEHIDHPGFKELLIFCRGTEIEMLSGKDMVCNRDGECNIVRSEKFKIIPKAIKFILPYGICYGKEEIQTERLVIRNLKAEDFEDFYEIISDAQVMPPAGSLTITNKLSAKRHLEDYIKNPDRYGICLKSTGKLIGMIKYQDDLKRYRVNSKSIGYELNRDYWGQGYMTEALDAFVQNAFENLSLDVLGIGHFSSNQKSRRVIEKCGFTYEGTIRKAIKTTLGDVEDDVSYSITKEEYFSRK